jgi:hypothetical protein
MIWSLRIGSGNRAVPVPVEPAALYGLNYGLGAFFDTIQATILAQKRGGFQPKSTVHPWSYFPEASKPWVVILGYLSPARNNPREKFASHCKGLFGLYSLGPTNY